MLKFKYAIGEAIREARLERGMTMRELSEKAMVSLGHICDVERGQKEGSSEILECLASGLGIPLYELLQIASWKMELSTTDIFSTKPLDLAGINH